MPLPLFFALFTFSTIVNAVSYGGYCPTSTCGKVPVRYPFYLHSTYSSFFCGYPGLALTCNNSDQLILTLPNNAQYLVNHIDYDSHSLTLIDYDVVTETSNIDCPRVRRSLTIDNSLALTNPSLNLTFYFNCSNVDVPNASIDCLAEVDSYGRKTGRRSYVFVSGKEPLDVEWGRVCGDKVVTAVVDERVKLGDSGGGYAEAVRLGFELDWGIKEEAEIDQCKKCEKSRGKCGYRRVEKGATEAVDEFACYCEDGGVEAVKCKKGLDLKTKLIIGFSVCGGTALIMLAILFKYQRRKKAKYTSSSYLTRNASSVNDPEKMETLYGVKFFTYDELEEATDSFDAKREIGDGGFGTVYLGNLKDGRTVAVKRLYENNYKRVEQFLNEVDILTRLRHKNLVMLYGCTSRHSRELLLVYEYVSNGTVADNVHGRNAMSGLLPWVTRLKIAVETASALKYLHASDIIHRDVKTNNILLDDNFGVKVADFGLSRLFPLDVTHVSTAPQGTPGYVDPEYHQCYQLTDKSDVYSFGVVLVELISSKPAVDITRHRHEINLSNMAMNKIQNGSLQELVDHSLGFDKDCNVHRSITAVAELAFQCLQCDRDMRPTMQEVLEILTRIQCADSLVEDKAEEQDIFSDEFVLLKSGPQPLSPDSVTVKWVSGSVASNSSG